MRKKKKKKKRGGVIGESGNTKNIQGERKIPKTNQGIWSSTGSWVRISSQKNGGLLKGPFTDA